MAVGTGTTSCRLIDADLHVFSVGGRYFAFDVRTITPVVIDEVTAEVLVRALKSSGDTIARELTGRFTVDQVRQGIRTAEALSEGGVLAPKTAYSPEPLGEVPRQPITNLHLMLTSSCTMNCVYCYGQTEFELHNGRRRMRDSTIRAAIDFLVRESLDATQISITFFGGEPLLELAKIKGAVAYALRVAETAGKTVRFDLTTNGSLLSDDTISILSELNINILLSWDGPADIQRRNRPFYLGDNEKQHDRTLERIRAFIKARGGDVGVRATVLPQDANRIPEVLCSFQELGVDRFALAMAEDTYGPGAGVHPIRGRRKKASSKTLDRAERFQAAAYLTYLLTGIGLKDMKLSRMVQRVYTGAVSRYGCGAGRGMLTVASNGDVLPCYRFIGRNLDGNPLVAGNVAVGLRSQQTASHARTESRRPRGMPGLLGALRLLRRLCRGLLCRSIPRVSR